jgi:uncharacterized membrane protein YtjA (UPF0391 family)
MVKMETGMLYYPVNTRFAPFCRAALRIMMQHRKVRLNNNRRGGTMLGWAIFFFILAILASIFGFGGLSAAFAGVAKILFFVFIILFVVALVFGFRGRRRV